jgi:hypothetical protein
MASQSPENIQPRIMHVTINIGDGASIKLIGDYNDIIKLLTLLSARPHCINCGNAPNVELQCCEAPRYATSHEKMSI